MTNGNELIERRRHKRFEAPTGVFVSFKPHDARLGEIIDISMGGIAFRYLATRKLSNGSYKLKIFLTEGGFCLNDLLFKTVTDCGTFQIPYTSLTMRRSGVQFGDLTHQQMSQLKHFIRNHTAGPEFPNPEAVFH